MIAAARLVLSWSALPIIYLDPTEPDRFVSATYGVMILYCSFSLYVLAMVWTRGKLPRLIENHSWWIDTVSYLILISLSSGTNSIYFFFFFFAVAAAAFGGGFRTGISVTGVSVIGFSALGILLIADLHQLDLGRYILRPLSLFVVGYMLSIWGEHQSKSLRRLHLLGEIGSVSNPRFGIDRTIEDNLERIREFFRADECIFIIQDPVSGILDLRYRSSTGLNARPRSLERNSPLSKFLLSPPVSEAAIWAEPAKIARYFRSPEAQAYNCYDHKFIPGNGGIYRTLAEAIGASSILTCPVYLRGDVIGRVLIASNRPDMFDTNDIIFLMQAIDQFLPIVENVRLVDRLASDAAEWERMRIARNIHDSIIQPYIGLQLGVESISQFLKETNIDSPSAKELARRTTRLEAMTKKAIDDLRNYVHGLSTTETGESSVLFDSLHRFTDTFTAGTGIGVFIEFESGLRLRDRLAAEVFQMIAEALSNVRKHTTSRSVTVRLRIEELQLMIEILNRADIAADSDFLPRSIVQRASSLGGKVNVMNEGEFTKLRIGIPM
ncbi:MAG: histidine kinase [Pyrinomonadaceae bacterium]